MIQTILYASDLGVFSPYSLAYVEQLARQFSAKILMLHVVPPVDALTAAVAQSRHSDNSKETALNPTQMANLLETIREQAFERLLDDEFGVDFCHYLSDIVVKTGAPAKTIIEFSQTSGSDIIVIGNSSDFSDGAPGLGSVASKVLQMAPMPVFMVPLGMASALPNRCLSDFKSRGL
jgi:nucleotide-binding universal stress UspA family protein